MPQFIRFIFCWLLLLSLNADVWAQTDPGALPPAQLDLNELGKRWFGISMAPGADSVVASKPQWAILPSLNSSPATGFAVGGILTTAFYPKDSPKTRLSTAGLYAGYSQYNQVLVAAIGYIWTRQYRYHLQSDWRYYNFPTTTFGLGGRTQLANASPVDYDHIRFYQSVYRAVGRQYLLGAGYLLDRHFAIQNLAPDGQPTDFDRYGKTAQSTSSGLMLGLLRDLRDNANNPTGGSYLLAQYRVYRQELGSSTNYQALWLDYRRYVPLGSGGGKQLAFWAFNWATFSGLAPYLDLPATGWDTHNNTARGYTMGRLRGPSYHYLEAEYRTRVTANGLVGAVLFANIQAVGPWPGGVPPGLETPNRNTALRTWPGVGGGLRVKVNKATRTNLAIDYGIGASGSRGLYFNLNEVF